MTQHFTTKRVSAIVKTGIGTGTITIPIPFVPDFVRADFHDIKHKPAADVCAWGLAAAPYGYDLTITYTTHEERDIKYVVAKLPVDPEQTISF